MSLYSIVLLASISIPLVLSFDKNLQFYKRLPVIVPVLLLISSLFILGDIIYTQWGVWGFTAKYHSEIYFFGLPLEECMFFILIPYACLFLEATLQYYFPKAKLTIRQTKSVLAILFLLFTAGIFLFPNNAYSLLVCLLGIFALAISYTVMELTRSFLVLFLVVLIPFLIIDGILTGTSIEDEIVWYNPNEIIGLRILTIPIEDVAYAFVLLFFNSALVYRIEKYGWRDSIFVGRFRAFGH